MINDKGLQQQPSNLREGHFSYIAFSCVTLQVISICFTLKTLEIYFLSRLLTMSDGLLLEEAKAVLDIFHEGYLYLCIIPV